MKNNEMVEKLSSLVQLDIDAIHAYDQAIQKIDVTEIKNQLNHFKGDHHRHVENLSELIKNYGGQPPSFSPDFKGFVIQQFTALRSVTGTEGALKAMRSNEVITNTSYDQALSWDVAPEAKRVIEQNRKDEARHLQYLEKAISGRIWERKAAA